MIAEPYICIKGPRAGEIHTFCSCCAHAELRHGEGWRLYADFERERLRELTCIDMAHVGVSGDCGYFLRCKNSALFSSDLLLAYDGDDYKADSESGRLLKRAEFLEAVCEKEGVAWLPEEKAVTASKGKLWVGGDEYNMKEIGDITSIRIEYEPHPTGTGKECGCGEREACTRCASTNGHILPHADLKERVRLTPQGFERGDSEAPEDTPKAGCDLETCDGDCTTQCSCRCHNRGTSERETYTKREVDERIEKILLLCESIALFVDDIKNYGSSAADERAKYLRTKGIRDFIEENRRRFLP